MFTSSIKHFTTLFDSLKHSQLLFVASFERICYCYAHWSGKVIKLVEYDEQIIRHLVLTTLTI